MTVRKFIVLLFIILVSACDSKKQPSSLPTAKQMYRYEEIPLFIRHTLDTVSGGKFVIANPGDSWSSGCTLIEGLPDKQFVSAEIKGNTFIMKYRQGGSIATTQRFIQMRLNGQEVVSYNQN